MNEELPLNRSGGYLYISDELFLVGTLNTVELVRHPFAHLEQLSPGEPDDTLLIDLLLPDDERCNTQQTEGSVNANQT